MNSEKLYIVQYGGGKGPRPVRIGLKEFSNVELTSIVPVADSGGSTGILRRDHDIWGMGDLTLAWADHCNDPLDAAFHRHRFFKGDINGHRTSNIISVVETEIIRQKALNDGIPESKLTSDYLAKEALFYHRSKFPITGNVYPVTTVNNLGIIIYLADGSTLLGEHLLDEGRNIPIDHIEPSCEAHVYPDAKLAIEQAHVHVHGPTSLRASEEMILAVKGVPEAIQQSKAISILVLNIANWQGDTLGFKASDYLEVITARTQRPFDYLVYFQNNQTVLDPDIITRYHHEGQEIVELDHAVSNYVKHVRCFDLAVTVEEVMNGEKKRVFRHDARKTARALMDIWEESLHKS